MNAASVVAKMLVEKGVAAGQASRLGAYAELVLAENRRTNLTGARDPTAFAEHLLDALTLASEIDGPLIDIGSGAGLPGVPLAIVTSQPVVLVDSVKKKTSFLARVLRELGLTGEAIDARAEKLGHDPIFRERFQCATARAVSSGPTVAELTVPFLAVGGRAFLQRGAMDERERRAVTDAAPMLGASFVEERMLPGDRRIVILLKQTRTQARFPRREGIPEKRPLCFV